MHIETPIKSLPIPVGGGTYFGLLYCLQCFDISTRERFFDILVSQGIVFYKN